MTDEKILEYTEKVQKLLDRDHICADVYPHYGLPVVVIDIHWGGLEARPRSCQMACLTAWRESHREQGD